MSTRHQESSSAGLLQAAWKHRLVFGLVLTGALLVSFLLAVSSNNEPFFQADAIMVLRDPSTADVATADDRYIDESIAVMRSPIIANAAAADLAETNPEMDITADELLVVPQVTRIPDSAIVVVSAVDLTSPERAVAMVNGLAVAFQDASRLEVTQASDAAIARIDAQQESINTRLQEISVLIQQTQDSDPEIQELRTQYREALTQIAILQAQLPNASDIRAAELRTEIADYRGRIDTYREATAAEGANSDLNALIEEEQQLVIRRTELLQRRDEISIDAELAPGAVALFEPAVEAIEVVDSSASRILAVGVVLGVLAAFGVAYLLEMRLRRFADRREPEAILRAPLLADIPDFSLENLATTLPVRDDPRSAAAESFRFASSSIQVALRGIAGNSVMFVSATLGHGKSTTAVNTAWANARPGHSVLVVDGDFGNQEASRLILGPERAPLIGLTELIEQDAKLSDAIETADISDSISLHVLGRGSRPSIAANLLASPKSVEVFESVKDTHDAVFVDAPPLLQVAYASALANQVDALVVVVSHGSSIKELEELVDRLQLINTPVLGYLYNRSPLRREMKASDGSMADILGQGTVGAAQRRSILRGKD